MIHSAPPPSEVFSICRPVRPLGLAVDGPVSEDLADQCAALGLLIGTPDAVHADERLLSGIASDDSIRRGIGGDFSGFVELGDEGLLGVGLRCFETVRSGGLAISLKTRSAYALPTLDIVCDALRDCMGLAPGERADLIGICLGEAISNAVMHGNLEVPAHLRVNSEGFQRFRQIMHERLNDPVLACRRVEINILPRGHDFIAVMVSDQGAGFNFAEHLNHTVDSEAKSGRGLGLISRICASLLAEDGGRTLTMTFAR
ncbi:ATP-binding protein [Paramagnetospirillum kuznetsovii]|uniref:ATP-binding protein n=1 Tax=Paramagnetospirillum kuznetsovii TaxID=2053833 RepID=A0A364NUV9_9PROT|nr:ATP-binding protein [Paramagnetospirillum kuznetsovii]RAU20695.1 ATP-binding protein [Paramagnetospirillum kuznetsovii]